MGWENQHLYEFKVFDYSIGIPSPEFENIVDAKTVTLGSVITEMGENFSYTYDFGDNWQHSVETEAILPIDRTKIYPFCIDGKMNCPPEDCGGIAGFYNLLEILKNKKHPAYKAMREWAGRYNPEKFNIEKTNKKLRGLPQFMGESEW